MQFMRHALVLPVLLAVTGCSYLFGDEGRFRERAMDYKQAGSIAPLQVPADMDAKERKQRYPIPPLGKGEFFVPEDSDDLPRPQGLVSVDEDAGIELRSDDDRHWLVVDQRATLLWPRLKEFLLSNGFIVEQEDAAKGTLETGWLQPRYREESQGFWASIGNFFMGDDDDLRERFRLTLDSASTDASTIVRINHVQTRKDSAALPQAADIKWPEQPEDPALVITLYNELMDFLGEGGRQIGVSVLSQDLKALPRFVMTYDGNGYPVLVINQDFNRAWQDVGVALKRAEVEVEDLDRSLGIYYLARRDEDAGEQALQLRLARSESGVQVSVQLDDDTLAPKDASAAILNRLRENLE